MHGHQLPNVQEFTLLTGVLSFHNTGLTGAQDFFELVFLWSTTPVFNCANVGLTGVVKGCFVDSLDNNTDARA